MSAKKLLLLATLSLLASCSHPEKPLATTQPTGPSPNPSLSPADVVKAVVLAMQHNDAPEPDAGIATAFRFASPGNRRITGPLEHFIPMVKSPAYAPLLNFKSVDFMPADVRGKEARLLIKLHTSDNQTAIFGWALSKQDEGEFANCWMTDQVVPLQEMRAPAPIQPPQGADEKGKL
jgi:hypothetical protein